MDQKHKTLHTLRGHKEPILCLESNQ